MSDKQYFRHLEINGGCVTDGPLYRFAIPATAQGYTDAQIDDYGRVGKSRRRYPWRPGTTMRLRARFSHGEGTLLGTAGFGFWNAPIGDPTIPWPALPQAAWFFYGSAPTDLPLAPDGSGRGWFAATINANALQALALLPLAPLIVALNQIAAVRRRLWPAVRQRLGVSYAPLAADMTQWHAYELAWLPQGCIFRVDGTLVLQTRHSPRGPLGFVCWIDNQYMVVTPRGRVGWGVLATPMAQWMEVDALHVSGG